MNDSSVQPPPSATNGGQSAAGKLKDYRKIVLLTDGYSTPFLAKTAISMLRYRREDVIAVLDSSEAGRTASDLYGCGGDIPIVDSLDGIDADAVFIGIAPPGGDLPAEWRPTIVEALRKGIDVVSGLHDFVNRNAEFRAAAKASGCRLIDVRQNSEREIANGQPFRKGCLRIHTVGHDCTVGKMVVALEVQQELCRREVNAQFVATGQTGIMVSGDGVPIDCVVSDFVNGATESLVRRYDHHDVLLIEGQGCLSHPSYSAVTLGLLHGCAPDGLIFCYEVGRSMVKGLDSVPLLTTRRLIDAYEASAALRHPSRVIGIAMNSRKVSPEEAAAECERVSNEFGLPVCDVYRDGPQLLADAVCQLKNELHS